jgi:uncharacterized protein YdeI (YjbR/CyaY-like superfamily)
MIRKQFKDRKQWRRWLYQNHHREREIWLVYYKKHTGQPSVSYEEAVQEALCYGWIDSTVRRLDEDRYMQKFTPRKENSNWSETNKKRARRLIAEGRMTRFGQKKIEAARANGNWNRQVETSPGLTVPKELQVALNKNKTAKKNFENLSVSYRKQYLGWLGSAKTDKTRRKRIALIVERAEKNLKPGMM